MGKGKKSIRFEHTERQISELAALQKMLKVSEGTFSFSIAICNSPSLQKYLLEEIVTESEAVEVVEINEKVEYIFDFVSSKIPQKNHTTAIFITGIERILPSDKKEHGVLRNLNATRELWKSRYSCPVVFWMPEYAATLFSTQARDIWSWVSHIFEFVSEEATAIAGTRDIYAGDITGAGNLNVVQKRFRIAELEQRIKDASEPLKDELVPHLLVWLNELSYIYYCIGELDAAEQMLRRAIEIEEKLGRPEGMAKQYGNLGLIYQTRGELDKAEQMHRKSLEIFEKLGLPEGMAKQYGNLGLIYKTRGELDKAEQMHKKSLDIAEKLGRLEGMANQYGNLGLIYKTRGELSKAEQMHRKALEIDERLGRLEGMAIDYGNLGVIYKTRGELDKAEQMLRKALEIFEKLGLPEGMAKQYGNLGAIYEERGDIKKAREYWVKARDLFAKIGMPNEVKKVEGWIEGI